MKNTSKYTLLYYLTASLMFAGIILLILKGITWPVGSEIIIGIVLYIHSLILTRSTKDLFLNAKENGLIADLFLQLQHGYDINKTKSESDA
jgi:uncharacterized membrane protein YjjP (DUF1212 family)